MGTGSFLGVEYGRGVTLTPELLLVLRYKSRVELYLYSPYGPLCPIKSVKPTYLVYAAYGIYHAALLTSC
jgi:hypothetical protein